MVLFRWCKLVLLVATLIILGGCSPDENEYFARAELRGGYHLIGALPIDTDQARNLKCYHFKRNDQGRLVEVTYQEAGKLAADPFFGVARITFDYGTKFETRKYYNADGVATPDNTGAYGLRIQKAADAQLELLVLDERGQIGEDNLGVSKYLAKLDGENIVELTSLDLSNQKVLQGFNTCLTRFEYDQEGRPVLKTYHNQAGRLAEGPEGFAKVTWLYDQAGNCTKETYYAADGNLAVHKQTGVSQVRSSYDAQGRKISEQYLNAHHQLVNHKVTQIASWKREYDSAGNITLEEYFDQKHRPTKDLSNGAFAIRRKYNASGEVVSEGYLNEQGKPMLSSKLGIACSVREYDQRGNLVSEEYQDLQGNLAKRQDWRIAQMKLRYDGQGQDVEMSFYDEDGQLCNSAVHGVAKIEKKYDNHGNLVELRFYGPDVQPKADLSGAALVRMNYNNKNELLKTSVYDLHNRLLQEY